MTTSIPRRSQYELIQSLRNPVRVALLGPHRTLAEVVGAAMRYPADITPFFALPDEPTDRDWADAATLLSGHAEAVVGSANLRLPPEWEQIQSIDAAIMAPSEMIGRRDDRVRALGSSDVPDMLDLVGRTHPGPFAARTIELGGYVGIRVAGELVAMGGYRFRGPGWIEISAICTAPAARGRGLGRAVVLHVAAAIEERGQLPILHVATTNPAQELYRKLGFRHLRTNPGALVRSPHP